MARLVLTRRALSDIEQLPVRLREAVFETLSDIEADPHNTGKPLTGRLHGLHSTRVGSYRVLFSISRNQVVVRAVRHRGVAYRSRKRR